MTLSKLRNLRLTREVFVVSRSFSPWISAVFVDSSVGTKNEFLRNIIDKAFLDAIK